MMDVKLLTHTPNALEVLLFTKGTRLQMTANGLEEIIAWPMERKMEELRYMLGTIQSSWEFVDYIFIVSGVTRAFTHQLVRHRVGTSFAQQAQRAVDMSGFKYETGDSILIDLNIKEVYDGIMSMINDGYQQLVQMGANKQDARGVLPTNIDTNIVFKANLRTLHDMGLKRLCVKAQGEFQNVFRRIVEEVNRAHPWTRDMIRVQCAWNGTCLFPTFPTEDCPVKRYVYNPHTTEAYGGGRPLSIENIYNIWLQNRAEAQPEVQPYVEPMTVEEVINADATTLGDFRRRIIKALPRRSPDVYSRCVKCGKQYGDHHRDGNYCPHKSGELGQYNYYSTFLLEE